MVCLASRAHGDSVRPRRLSDVVVRPLNFTVRAQDVASAAIDPLAQVPWRLRCDGRRHHNFNRTIGGAQDNFDDRRPESYLWDYRGSTGNIELSGLTWSARDYPSDIAVIPMLVYLVLESLLSSARYQLRQNLSQVRPGQFCHC